MGEINERSVTRVCDSMLFYINAKVMSPLITIPCPVKSCIDFVGGKKKQRIQNHDRDVFKKVTVYNGKIRQS